MHGTEDAAMLDHPQQGFIGFQKRAGTMKLAGVIVSNNALGPSPKPLGPWQVMQ
jgi:hypothetical protein